MLEGQGRMAAHRSLALAVMVVAAGACNATGATAIPTKVAVATAAPSAAPAASGPTAYASTTFSAPFSFTLPAGWKVFEETADMFTAYLSTDHETLDVAIDIQVVPAVYADPCNKGAGTVDGGTTAADLAAWMLAYKPMAGTAGAPTMIGGSNALVIDEAWAGTPCLNGELWPTSGGWLEASDHKRFFIFDVGARRIVAAIATSDEKFDANVAAGLAALASLTFHN